MNKYGKLSLSALVLFLVMFFMLMNGFRVGMWGKVYLTLMFTLPLVGFLLGFKAKKGLMKWLLIGGNLYALLAISYIMLLAFGMGES